MTIKTADLFDDHGEALRIPSPVFSDYGGRIDFHGPVVTVKCHEDNSLVREILGEPGAGRVLVVDGGGSLRCALVGDILAKKGVDNGWAGVVVYGCIRDAAEIAALPIGVKALATHPAKSDKRGVGERDVTLRFEGVTVSGGDYLYADADGIAISAVPLHG